MRPATTFEQFGFEEHDPGLDLLPLAARRALDAAGVALSLDAWRALSLSDRRALITAGAADVVSLPEVERIALVARPAPDRSAKREEPRELPPELAAEVGAHRAELERAWPSLRPLERYALWKVAGSRKADPLARAAKLERACAELLAPRSPALTHLTAEGDAHMVDVGEKQATLRRGVARAFLRMQPETLAALLEGRTPKGDVLAAARIAGIQAAKRTPELIPLCHAIHLTGVEVALEPQKEPPGVTITATAKAFDRTGVEMEALVAASTAALTLYDMLKAIDRGMTVVNLELVAKSGGRSGDFQRGKAP